VVVVLYTARMQRILVVSDDPQHMTLAAAAMRLDGRPVRTERTLEAGLLAVREWRPAMLVLDLGIGITSGGLAAVLRDPEVHERIGVLLIASAEHLELVGAGVRVDDFVMPPLEAEEFRTRIARVLWTHTGADEGSLLRRRGLVIDLERYTVSVDGEVVDLTYKEYELLRFLATNAGKPFTREALLNRVWGYDYYGGSRTVDVHIRRIRAKIERHEAYIDTVRNVGYRFIDDAPPAGRTDALHAEGL
jgi:DNA-binding response OmpR family regulator